MSTVKIMIKYPDKVMLDHILCEFTGRFPTLHTAMTPLLDRPDGGCPIGRLRQGDVVKAIVGSWVHILTTCVSSYSSSRFGRFIIVLSPSVCFHLSVGHVVFSSLVLVILCLFVSVAFHHEPHCGFLCAVILCVFLSYCICLWFRCSFQ